MSIAPRGLLDLDFSGIAVTLRGLAAADRERLAAEWSPFGASEPTTPFLTLDVRYDGGAYDKPTFRPKRMQSEFRGTTACFRMSEGSVEVDAGGTGRLSLLDSGGDRRYYTLQNMIRAGLAWCLPSRSAGMFHGAGLVVSGMGFLLVGPEGSGKSSWARIAGEAGVRVLSDDVVVIDGSNGRFEVLGTPFRSTYRADYRPGRWPLAAVLFPVQGSPPEWRKAPRLLSQARLIANLPFVAEGLESDGRIEALVGRVAGEVPCGELTFGLDPSFLRLLAAWPPAGAR